jgi:1-acyl-sn-glycerol-3-phosphate acyltransferase
MTLLRSTLFNLFFFCSTFVLTVPATIASLLAPRRVMGWAKSWARTHIRALRIICGIRLEISGWNNLPTSPVLITSRHESILVFQSSDAQWPLTAILLRDVNPPRWERPVAARLDRVPQLLDLFRQAFFVVTPQ